ncbi:hypothetical protein Aph02nite_26460 [Actinoplanes philippinensis]|uniref:Uncharacterized protein n=1 Tax=Actinoplanes philippinensis TaxID=35752 RepID=A0A1I2G8M7_9ACTN|nr:hypothetical protein [Actinoplanes philippinensis]GIE76696.1 hypothetical protein Aph02nite_26460 [Actinoplanes philippinensis]SFF13568.1 hypothetical protein SAMN05421541_106304 [Actinoplanes philippinensis]
MKVLCRSQSGQWIKWRVGRRRMVWFGTITPGLVLLEIGLEISFLLPLALLGLAWILVTFLSCLLVTMLVLPFRYLRDRWTVIAYELGDPLERPEIRQKVKGRRAADALVREWAAIIEREGRLIFRDAPDGPQVMPADGPSAQAGR